MPLLPVFDPPGNLNDITDPELRRRWSERIAGFFETNVAKLQSLGLTPQFYNPLVTEATQ